MKRIMIDEIESRKYWGDYRNELPQLEAEAEEARKLAKQNNTEIVFAFYWTDDYGRKEGQTFRKVVSSVEEATNAYSKQKDGNGNYVQGWIEVRPMGETKRIEEIHAELQRLHKELKKLEEGE